MSVATPRTLTPSARFRMTCARRTSSTRKVRDRSLRFSSRRSGGVRINRFLVTNRYNQNCIRFQWYNALEAWTVPPEITHQRTGVLSYINPWVEAQLRKQSPEAQLAELILSAFDSGTLHGNEWEGTARELKDQLTADSASCNRDARLLLSGWIAATGTYLSRLAATRADYERDYGLRVVSMGQRKGVERYGLLRLSS